VLSSIFNRYAKINSLFNHFSLQTFHLVFLYIHNGIKSLSFIVIHNSSNVSLTHHCFGDSVVLICHAAEIDHFSFFDLLSDLFCNHIFQSGFKIQTCATQ
jgi:hypothetical protein